MSRLFAGAGEGDARRVAAGDVADDVRAGELDERLADLSARDLAAGGQKLLVNESVIGKESAVGAEQLPEDDVRVGRVVSQIVEVLASDEDAHAGGVFGLLLVEQVA